MAGDEAVPQQPPAAIAIVSGNDQEGKSNEALAEQFVVRVTDAQGNGVVSVTVSWSVASGGGALPSSTTTNADGVAQVSFTPMVLGTSTVTASVPDIQGASVIFTAEATAQVIRLFEWWVSPVPVSAIRPTDVTVPVRTRIEWLSPSPYSISSLSTPTDGQPFDSGRLRAFERYVFVPEVSGTWDYEARDWGDVATPVLGTITAQ